MLLPSLDLVICQADILLSEVSLCHNCSLSSIRAGVHKPLAVGYGRCWRADPQHYRTMATPSELGRLASIKERRDLEELTL